MQLHTVEKKKIVLQEKILQTEEYLYPNYHTFRQSAALLVFLLAASAALQAFSYTLSCFDLVAFFPGGFVVLVKDPVTGETDLGIGFSQ